MLSKIFALGALTAVQAGDTNYWKSRAVYQILTDRFAKPTGNNDGACTDLSNYCGGTWKGIQNNLDYIAGMGFDAIWITPVVDNLDNGYHGYWATNFYKADEHLVSDNLSVSDYTAKMREHALKSVFDIVANHGTPSFTMQKDLPGYGEIYDKDGNLVADHQNLAPEDLDPKNNPLHSFFHDYPDLVKLSNLDDENPAVRDYLINSYLYWISQGADVP